MDDAIDFPRTPEPVVLRIAVRHFVESGNQWSDIPLPEPGARASVITCVTFNTWFQGPEPDLRYRGLLETLRESDADVILLQEVTTRLLDLLLAADWIRSRYRYARAPFRSDAIPSHGVMLLSRLPLAGALLHPLPTHMGRALLAAELMVNGVKFVFATAHLESMKPYADVRGKQLEAIFPVIDNGQHAVLAGDFNFCSFWPEENERIDRRYLDVWPALQPTEPGYTQNTDLNPMLAQAKQETKKVRFDRILLRSEGASGRWIPETVELLGTAPVDPKRPAIFPSDHFGLAARIRFMA